MTAVYAILIFGLLIFIHEFGHFTAAKSFNILVHEFSIGMGPAIFKKKKGETQYSLRAFPIGGFVKLEGEDGSSDSPRAFCNAKAWKRIIVLVAGAAMNILLGFIIYIFIFSFASGIATPVVKSVSENSPAAEAGIMPGDRIVRVGGSKVNIYSDISLDLYLNGGNPIDITVSRGGEIKTFNITPKNDDGRYILGFKPELEKPAPGIVLHSAFYNTIFIVKAVYVSLKELIFGRVPVNEMSGPVGIVGEISKAAKYGILDVLSLAALIAVNLGVMNMLPFPALDGGRVIFVLIEILRGGKQLKPEVEGYVHMIGFMLLIALMLFITYSDITKLF
ncbi:MAG: RIP metalloprotease RseP [Clostridia bacterium]|nr:RIP metalloprotease RseP [Clostridia bacterium]